MKKVLTILGSTGSIGQSTLEVVRRFRDRFEIKLLAAGRSREKLLAQAMEFNPDWVAVEREMDALWLKNQLDASKTKVIFGPDQLARVVKGLRVNLTVSAIVGAAGLRPTMAAIKAGSDIALANKESMVVAGAFVRALAQEKQVKILPVDSEHNALHQCLRGEKISEVQRLILTASGGPFRTYEGDFDTITPEQALNHPTWDMGPKITIDSATMMNKGLEVIEAHHLFGFRAHQIDIVVHPQSIIHSMVQTIDGSYLCQLGKNDMKHPILYALAYPERWQSPFEPFDIVQCGTLEFERPDRNKFPCISLAYNALQVGGAAPAVLNAANEVSVQAFLDRKIRFSGIAIINSRCLEKFAHREVSSIDGLIDVDQETRRQALRWIRSDSLNVAP